MGKFTERFMVNFNLKIKSSSCRAGPVTQAVGVPGS